MSVEITPNTRAATTCKHFGMCGSCDLLDLPYGEELAQKATWVEDLFMPVLGGRSVAMHGARQPLYYRSKLKAPFANTNEALVAGFYRRGTHKVQNIRQCRIQQPELLSVLEATRRIARELGLRGYSERTGHGLLRHLVARRALSGEMLAGLVVRRSGEKKVRLLATALMQELAELGLVGVIENHNPQQGNRILGKRQRVLEGGDRLHEVWRGLEIDTGLAAFVQAHREQADVLYDRVLELLGPVEGQHVADVYAGFAPMGLLLAQAGARVSAVESERQAVEDGRRAAESNELAGSIRFHQGLAQEGLREIAASDAPALDAVIVDPPRAGLDPAVVARLIDLGVPRIAYVSCNPKALKRDVESLSIRYRLKSLEVFDLFPRTEHVEVLALLEG